MKKIAEINVLNGHYNLQIGPTYRAKVTKKQILEDLAMLLPTDASMWKGVKITVVRRDI